MGGSTKGICDSWIDKIGEPLKRNLKKARNFMGVSIEPKRLVITAAGKDRHTLSGLSESERAFEEKKWTVHGHMRVI